MTEDDLLKFIVSHPKLLSLKEIHDWTKHKEVRSTEWLLRGLIHKGLINQLNSPSGTYYSPTLRSTDDNSRG